MCKGKHQYMHVKELGVGKREGPSDWDRDSADEVI